MQSNKKRSNMEVIYEPRGKAFEYAPLALNLYRGCSHACIYCYAPSATFRQRDEFSTQVKVRIDIIKQVKQCAAHLNGDNRNVLLSFTSDAYQPLESQEKITRRALRILTENNIHFTVLTKAGKLPQRDFDLFKESPENCIAVTLTLIDPTFSIQWEPGASLPQDRIDLIRTAHSQGIKTWISFEPVLNPESVYSLIKITHEFTDLYKIGKLNYHPLAKQIDWVRFRETVKEQLTKLNKPFIIKKDLQLCR